MSIETETVDEYASAVRLVRPGPYRISVPSSVLADTRIEDGEAVTVRLEVAERFPRLVIGSTTEGGGKSVRPVTRTLDARSGEDEPHLTLPKACVEAGGFVGHRALPHTGPDGDSLLIGLSRPSGIADVALAAVETLRLSRYRSGELVASLSERVAGPLAAAETLSCWFDYTDGQPVFVFGAPAVAPQGAIELTANPNTGRDDQPGLSVYLPRLLARLCGVDGGRFRWGRTVDGNRLLGVPVDV